MRGRPRPKDAAEAAAGGAEGGAEVAPRPLIPAGGSGGPPGPGLPGRRKGTKCSIYDGGKVYLGVRVRKTVRDLLKNIRLSQGGPHLEAQVKEKRVKVERKRVTTRASRRAPPRKQASKGLEELAIIVEVLEEDLRSARGPPTPPLTSPQSPNWSPAGPAGYSSDELDEMIPSPDLAAEYQQVPSPHGVTRGWAEPPSPDGDHDSSHFFWTQLQKEASTLRGITDAALLHLDGHGRTVLHQVACIGRRALGYCIATRMAALNLLDLRDSAGMTPLLHAAAHNHHLMVADLIHLGSDPNARDNSGKSCLHLSAEKGYIRVLEVLKQAMMDGVYIDVEATDNSGMSVIQCASVATKAAVRDLESGKCFGWSRLHALRQGQMMETLECLLQMGSYLHTMGSRAKQPTG